MTTNSITNDLEKIQGTWKQIAYERDGVKEHLDEQSWEPQLTFSANSFVVGRRGTDVLESCICSDPMRFNCA